MLTQIYINTIQKAKMLNSYQFIEAWLHIYALMTSVIIGLNNGFSPISCQASTWTNANL